MSHSIMLNGVKATITFQDTTDNHTIHWELIIESGENKAVTDGSITMDVIYFEPRPTLEPVVLEERRKKIEDRRREERRDKREEMKRIREKEVKDKVPTVEDVTKHVCKALHLVTDEDRKNHIHKCIKAVETGVGTKQKAKLAQILYDYMTNESLDYVKGYEQLKKVAIERANSFKKDCKEFPELIASLDAFLTAVGAPLVEPVVECVKYCTCEKCIEKQTMKEIMKQEDEYCKRWQLMKKLFERENLVFDDDVMDLYYEWEKTAPQLNRYKKMKAFINANSDTLKRRS